MDTGLQHAAEFRRCIEQLDVVGVRRLWQHVSPHLPQPKDDREALHTLHLARVRVETLPPKMRQYSQDWLDAETARLKVSCGVGISIEAPIHRRTQAAETRAAMSGAVTDSIKAGIDIDTEAAEVRLRMNKAREKLWRVA